MRGLVTAAAALAISLSVPATAATLVVVNGELTGASGVDVGGTLYDVSFFEGTCAQAFSGCDQLSDFDFVDSASAGAAAQALLDQVFLDGIDGQFDTDPTLTFGCAEERVCRVAIPFSLIDQDGTGDMRLAQNWRPGDLVADNVNSALYNGMFDTSSLADHVWAQFTPAGAAVPEPSTWAMMLLGFGAVGFSMRRKARAKIAYAVS